MVKKARKLASDGMSRIRVARLLKLPKGQVQLWCREIPDNTKFKNLLAKNESKRTQFIESEKEIVNFDENNIDIAKVYCGILYGCEGSKYPANVGVAFVNSDPEIMRSFVRLLRISFKLNEKKFRIHLQIHDTQNYPELVQFWSKRLNIPENQFYKPTITGEKGGKHRKEYWGTCSLRYGDYGIQLKLIGIFDEFLRKCTKQEGGQDGNARDC